MALAISRYFIFLLLISTRTIGQEERLPRWVSDHFNFQIGIWKADNRDFKNENEPFTDYRIEWQYGEIKSHVYGSLTGWIHDQKIATLWEFHQYYNPRTQTIDIWQIGWNGTIGTGVFTFSSPQRIELIQEFTSMAGFSRTEKHTYERPDEKLEITTSFEMDVLQNWSEKRTYRWVKM